MTKTQRKYLNYIEAFIRRKGYQPTLEEVAKHFHRSVSTIHTTLKTGGVMYASYRILDTSRVSKFKN